MIYTNKAEMLITTLMDIWENAENYSINEVLNTYEEMGKLIESQGRQLGKDTKEVIMELRKEKGLCPICSNKLEYVSVPTDTNEAWGKSVQMYETIATCGECGWSSEENNI